MLKLFKISRSVRHSILNGQTYVMVVALCFSSPTTIKKYKIDIFAHLTLTLVQWPCVQTWPWSSAYFRTFQGWYPHPRQLRYSAQAVQTHMLPIHKFAWGKVLGSLLLHSFCLAINYYYSHRRYPACVLNFTRKNNLCTCKEGFMCKIQNQRFKCNPDSL